MQDSQCGSGVCTACVCLCGRHSIVRAGCPRAAGGMSWVRLGPLARRWRSACSSWVCLPRPPVILSQMAFLSTKTVTSFPDYTPAVCWPLGAEHSLLLRKAFKCMKSPCAHTGIYLFFLMLKHMTTFSLKHLQTGCT